MPHRRLLVVVVTVLMLLPQAAATAVPIEGFSRYQPQTRCSPHPKPGTVKLAAWLQRTYPGSGSLGISRSCRDGGVSEHKEGRAFDWAVSVHSARDRAYVHDFMRRLFATDAAGNRDALARRMGIMYLIWDDHIYASYSHFRKRSYLHAGCRSRKRCSETLRHRNHVHISLTRRGGMGLTSWYTHAKPTTVKPAPQPAPQPAPKPAPRPAPKPAPRPAPTPAPVHHRPRPGGVLDLRSVPYARLTVPTDGSVLESRFKLQAGRTYIITAAGLYTYGSPRQVADAACVWSSRDASWQAGPGARRSGSLDLRVNGTRPFGNRCSGSHVYRAAFTPKRTRSLTLGVANRGATSGPLVFTVSRRGVDVTPALPSYPTLAPAPVRSAELSRGYGLLSETVDVPAREAVSTRSEVQAGVSYRITVTGAVSLGRGAWSDGTCIGMRGAWYPQASLDLRFPDQDHGQLYLDGAPLVADGGCTSHQHVSTWTAARTGRLELDLWDPLGPLDPRDDEGALNVRVQRLTPIPVPAPARSMSPEHSWSWWQDRDWLRIHSEEPDGEVSSMRLRRGEKVHVVVKGVQGSGRTEADASCVRTAVGWLPRDPEMALEQDPLDLWVDGQPVSWRALGRGSGVCSEDDHAYITEFTATKDGPLSFDVLDLDHRDNWGTLSITLLRG